MQKTRDVIILGATGTVGQRMIALLDGHPWLRVAAFCASDRSVGKSYYDACKWSLDAPMPAWAASTVVAPCDPTLPGVIALSALDASVAGEIELKFAEAGKCVISNAKNHRLVDDVPLVIPEVNAGHLDMIPEQRRRRGWQRGCLVTNPNCSTVGLVSALKPLHDRWEVRDVSVVTMQAVSGAGYPGVASLDILDNVIPHIGGEEEKMHAETRKILGWHSAGVIYGDPNVRVSATCARVPVRDGHLECVSVRLGKPATPESMIAAWREYEPMTAFAVPLQRELLPTLPEQFVRYLPMDDRPQPRRDREYGRGMTVTVGRLRPCPILDWKFVVLSHNTVRGAAGAAIANAELLVAKSLVP